jgi:ABC-type branched-subunit amino acid transport system ATPase component
MSEATQVEKKKLHVRNMTKSFNGRTVVNVPDLVLGAHGIEGLIGPNGAGKTTLMSVITNKLKPDTGGVTYYPNGEEIDISAYTLEQIAQMGIVRTTQIIQDFESLGIKDSMLLSLSSSKYERFWKVGKAESQLRKEAKEEMEYYLDYFHFQDPGGHALSAGEKKLLDIIRCLMLKPKFLLMDEPTVGLPMDQTEKVMELMREKADKEDMAILVVEHDLDLIWNVSEYVHFMAEGEIMIQGTVDEIRQHKTVVAKYIGESHV